MKKRKIKFFQQLRYLCVAGVCILGLVTIIASGGGGDEEGGGPIDTSQPLSLTSSNALGVTGLTLDAAEGAITAGSIPQEIVSSTHLPGGGSFDINILRIAQVAFRNVLEASQIVTPSVWGRTAWPPTDPDTLICTGGGNVEIDYQDDNMDGQISVNESATLDYNNCGELGLTLNGQITMAVSQLTNDPSADPIWLIKLRLFFGTLTATDGGGSVIRVVGTLDVTVDANAPLVAITVTTELGPGIDDSIQFAEGDDFINLTSLLIVLVETTPGGDFTLSARGTLESTLIAGWITFLTTTPLEGTDFDNNNPDDGDLEITGALGSKILLEVLDAVNVRLHVDIDGDGIYEPPPIDTTWNAVDAAADVL